MVPEQLHRLILITVVEDRPVVGAQYNQRFFRETEPIQCRENLADAPIEFKNGISSRPLAALASKPFVRSARHMNVMGRKEQEEPLVSMGFDPPFGSSNPFVGKIFVAETRPLSSGVETDATDSVVDRSIVTNIPIHFEFGTMADPCRMVWSRFVIANPQGIRRIEMAHSTIFDKHLRDTVVGGRQKQTVVEADIQRPWLEIPVPIRLGVTESKMPFSDDCGRIALLLQQGSDRGRSGTDDGRSIRGRDTCPFFPKCIRPREEGKTRGGACGRGTVAAGESNSLAG